MIVGCVRESSPGEDRVALVPSALPLLKKAGLDVLLESGAGAPAGYPDSVYQEKEATIAASRQEVFEKSDILAMVRAPGANPRTGASDAASFRPGQIVVGFSEPLTEFEANKAVAGRGAMLFAMELMPRITRAQSMDALSSMATISGYKAVLLAASGLPKMFPMMTTAAGAIAPARALIIGAGVAGLQAIATARRLGAIVSGYDVRPAAKEQVESLGAKFVELPLESKNAEDSSGYAKALGEEFYRKQRELMARVVAQSDVVISTAAVPGKKAPILVTAEMVKGMAPGSIVVDLAAERGGNCELTKPGEQVVVGGVTILGPVNLPSSVPYHASQMYARNVTNFLTHLVKKGELQLDLEDEITRETLVARDGQIVHARILELMGTPLAAVLA